MSIGAELDSVCKHKIKKKFRRFSGSLKPPTLYPSGFAGALRSLSPYKRKKWYNPGVKTERIKRQHDVLVLGRNFLRSSVLSMSVYVSPAALSEIIGVR